MTTHLQAAEVRLAQAVAAREAAEQALAEAMVEAGIRIPRWASAREVMGWRQLEARLEHPSVAGSPLAKAHAVYRRAQRAEAKAKSAAHAARWQTFDRAAAVKWKPEAMDAAEVTRRLKELRAA